MKVNIQKNGLSLWPHYRPIQIQSLLLEQPFSKIHHLSFWKLNIYHNNINFNA